MADKNDKTAKPPPRTPAARLRTLATAALTADEKVDQMEALLETMTGALSGMDNTMKQFNSSLIEIDKLAPRLLSMVDRMEAMVDRVERIIGVAEVATSPISAAESAVRGVVGVFTQLGGKSPDKNDGKPQ